MKQRGSFVNGFDLYEISSHAVLTMYLTCTSLIVAKNKKKAAKKATEGRCTVVNNDQYVKPLKKKGKMANNEEVVVESENSMMT